MKIVNSHRCCQEDDNEAQRRQCLYVKVSLKYFVAETSHAFLKCGMYSRNEQLLNKNTLISNYAAIEDPTCDKCTHQGKR